MATNNNNDSKNVLNSDAEFKGTLRFSGELTFDGKLEGDITSEGALNLGDNAVVKGNINANSVVVRGKVTGNIIARDKIDIKSRTELFHASNSSLSCHNSNSSEGGLSILSRH